MNVDLLNNMGIEKSRLSKKKRSIRIAMFGLDKAGKTAILYRLKLHEFVTTIPTSGFNRETVHITSGLSFTIWDIGGDDKIRPLWKMYLKGSKGLIYVIDSSDEERLEEARKELFSICKLPNFRGIPIVVMANKQDLPGAMEAKYIADFLKLKTQTDRDWCVRGSSALTGNGAGDSLEILAKLILDIQNER
ncbi:hypothetical protein CHS0354_024225 [Potamilus streckersoni]|uniref:ADP-ribosylation factor n=1 Tax=Potamilus streckersoni TaxID=2493646 RepID=A0AAE0SBG3_9BIVA|nr:hypothetical protein CHS0354_024225 [Potamilus streckersoni]